MTTSTQLDSTNCLVSKQILEESTFNFDISTVSVDDLAPLVDMLSAGTSRLQVRRTFYLNQTKTIFKKKIPE